MSGLSPGYYGDNAAVQLEAAHAGLPVLSDEEIAALGVVLNFRYEDERWAAADGEPNVFSALETLAKVLDRTQGGGS